MTKTQNPKKSDVLLRIRGKACNSARFGLFDPVSAVKPAKTHLFFHSKGDQAIL
jgi:hypothetical protein